MTSEDITYFMFLTSFFQMEPMKKIKDGNQTLMGEVEMTILRLDTENKNLLAENAKMAEKHAKLVQENTMLTQKNEALRTKLASAEKCPDCKRGSRNRVCQECLNKK